MNSKTLTVTGVIAAVLVLGAVLTSQQESSRERPAGRTTAVAAKGDSGALIPGLQQKADSIGKVIIQNATEKVTLVRSGDEWGLEEKGGYPVRFDRVSELMKNLAEMEKLEKKTELEANYARIEVEDISAEGAKSRQITILDKDGKTLADLIIGKTDYLGSEARQFVRAAGEKQAWLASGALNTATDDRSWLDTQIVDVAPERVALVEVIHPDGETVRASKGAESAQYLALENVPEGREIQGDARTHSLASMLRSTRFDDVKKLEEIDLAGLEPVKAAVETFTGVRYESSVYTVGEDKYVVMNALAVPERVEKTNAERTTAAEMLKPQEGTEEGEGVTATVGPELIEVSAAESEAEKFNSKFGVWAYQIPAHVADRLTRRVDYFLKELPSETAEATGEASDLEAIPEPEIVILDESTSPGTAHSSTSETPGN